VRIGTLKVHPVTLTETLEFIESAIEGGRRARVFNVNAHAVNLAAGDPEFRTHMLGAELVFCDGVAVKWASRLLGRPFPARFTPPDWIDILAARAVANGYRMFFLGAEPGVAAAAAENLRLNHPGLSIGALHGFYQKEGAENRLVVDRINQFEPHLLLVGFGMPAQEKWITENLPSLRVNAALSVGALFDTMAGAKQRGPAWLTASGFEWLTRLVYEPRRLWRRYLLGNPRFVGTVFSQWARQRRTGGPH
jgi:N-acetylglucosaminyldiphosphoundecaprenol N-acetyl-beta-D-mannosaminyltransferase